MHYVQKKISSFLAWLPGISANSNENYKRYNFQAFANIYFRKFSEILNWREIHNPYQVVYMLYLSTISEYAIHNHTSISDLISSSVTQY